MDEPNPSTEEVITALQRICESHVFARKDRLRDLLKYLVDRALADQEVKESTVLSEFFRRESGGEDESNIVRSNINNLRTSLADYYDTEGADDEVRVSIPRRGYSAAFTYSMISRMRAELDRKEERLREQEIEIERRHEEFQAKVREFEVRQSAREAAEIAALTEMMGKFKVLDEKFKNIAVEIANLWKDAAARETRILEAVKAEARGVVMRLGPD